MNCDLAGQDFKIIAVSNRKNCVKDHFAEKDRTCISR